MEKLINLSHTKETLYFALSKTIDRISFYGLRSIIILYMIGDVLKMEHTEAFKIYGLFTTSFLFSKIIGGIIGDLILGNKNTIIVGGILQALGAFSFCIPSTIGFYIGLFLVVLGGGLFSPNIISNFGKLYLKKGKLLDSGFTLFYLAVNIGSLLGTLTVGYMATVYGWNVGFILVGIMMLLSILPILFTKEKDLTLPIRNNTNTNQGPLIVLISIGIIAIYWTIYELGSNQMFQIQSKMIEISTLNLPKEIWSSLNAVFILPISIIMSILWTTLYQKQFVKLCLGFIFGAISFSLLFLIPEIPVEQQSIFYIVSIFFLALSEIYMAPIINSILTRYSNPKYLAIIMSIAFIPTRLFALIVGFYDELTNNPIIGLKVGMISMIVISILLISYISYKKLNITTERNQ